MTSGVEAESLRELRQLADEVVTDDLDPISPEDAVSMYLSDRKQELRESSLTTHRSALRFFCDWCSQEGIQNLNNLSGRQLQEYRIWRRDEATTKVDSLSKQTVKTQQDILRQFIRYCESIDAVTPRLHEKVRSPTVSDEESAKSETVNADLAQTISQWLEKYEYASLEHAVWVLLSDTGARIGGIVALDVDDYRPNTETPHIRVRHRPNSGTELKNGEDGERLIALSPCVCKVIDDYIDQQRPDVPDEYGRQPLLTTSHGRVAKSTVRKYIYKWTRLCAIGEDCPHGRNPETCEAGQPNNASKCPSSKSPHAVRRGYISHELSSSVDQSLISDRCNVSGEILEKHYDARDEYERMRVRRRELTNARRSHDSYGGQ